nr:hypothetical protein [Nitrospira sp.]
VLASTAGVLKGLLPYRPWFIGLTVLLLSIGFYLAYRKPRAFPNNASCTPACATRMDRMLLWFLSVLAMVFVLAPYWLSLYTS